MQIFKLCKIFMKSQSLFSENIKKKYFKMSSAENFTQYALALTVVMTHDCIHVLLPWIAWSTDDFQFFTDAWHAVTVIITEPPYVKLCLTWSGLCRYENMPIQIYWNFYHPKKIFFFFFQIKFVIFFIFLLKT